MMSIANRNEPPGWAVGQTLHWTFNSCWILSATLYFSAQKYNLASGYLTPVGFCWQLCTFLPKSTIWHRTFNSSWILLATLYFSAQKYNLALVFQLRFQDAARCAAVGENGRSGAPGRLAHARDVDLRHGEHGFHDGFGVAFHQFARDLWRWLHLP